MAENSQIEWTDNTFNAWIGCTKVAPGCKHCYAEALAKRFNKAAWGPSGTRVKTSEKYWQQPVGWNKRAAVHGVRRRVFCASLADVFEDWNGSIVDHEGNRLFSWVDVNGTAIDGSIGLTMADVRKSLFALIDETPSLDWQLLTKRPENIRKMMPHKRGWPVCANREDCTHPECVMSYYRDNVWLGTSISDQETADVAIPELLNRSDLAPVLFLSVEPLLGPIDLNQAWRTCRTTPDWVIIGGESGHGARRCETDWIISLVEQCRDARIPVFVKQLGSRCFNDRNLLICLHADHKGGDQRDWPYDVPRFREFPEVVRV